MRIIVVEDDSDNADAIRDLLQSRLRTVTLEFVGDKETAIERIGTKGQYFDLIILDRKIPNDSSGRSGPETAHGEAVLEYIRRHAPAAIVCVLTAFQDMGLASALQNRYRVKTVLTGIPALQFIMKEKMLEVGEVAVRIDTEINELRIAVKLDLEPSDAPIPTRLLLRQLGHMTGATQVNAKAFSRGLSGATTYRVDLFNEHGLGCGNLVAKIDIPEQIDVEVSNFRRYVGPQLRVGDVPQLIGEPDFIYDRGALCYRLAKEYPYSFFEFVRKYPDRADVLVAGVERIDQQWITNNVPQEVTVRQLLKRFDAVELDTLPETFRKKVVSLLDVSVTVLRATQHSDLHGENILVSTTGEPVFIDFERVGRLPVPADPVMLELSMALHPGAAPLRGTWPTPEQASRWWHVDEYAAGSPVHLAVASCRDWAKRVVQPVGVRGVPATALAFCLWQLGFPSVERDVCVAIATSAADELAAILGRDMDV